MAEPVAIQLKDVHQAFHRAQDCITIVETISHMGVQGAQTKYDAVWRQNFDAKANELVTILAQELGANWHMLPYDTKLPQKTKQAFEEVLKLLPN